MAVLAITQSTMRLENMHLYMTLIFLFISRLNINDGVIMLLLLGLQLLVKVCSHLRRYSSADLAGTPPSTTPRCFRFTSSCVNVWSACSKRVNLTTTDNGFICFSANWKHRMFSVKELSRWSGKINRDLWGALRSHPAFLSDQFWPVSCLDRLDVGVLEISTRVQTLRMQVWIPKIEYR